MKSIWEGEQRTRSDAGRQLSWGHVQGHVLDEAFGWNAVKQGASNWGKFLNVGQLVGPGLSEGDFMVEGG